MDPDLQWHCCRCAMTITDIRQQNVRLISKILGYKMHYSSRVNSVSVGIIHATYKTVKDNEHHDICEIIRVQLLDNLRGSNMINPKHLDLVH